MERLRKILLTIQTYLGQMNPSQKLLIGSLVVIMLMTLFLVSQYASKPAMVELLPGTTSEDRQRAVSYLSTNDIRYKEIDGKLMVLAEDRPRVLSRLSESGLMPADQVLMFKNIVGKQSLTMSRSQSDQQFTIALGNELAMIISRYRGIKRAQVLLDVPAPHGLGSIVRQPTAAVTVWTADGGPLSQRQVDAIAGQVAGARAGLSPQNVRVIDGTGVQRAATSEDDLIPTTYLEHAHKVEQQMRDKIQNLLGYIPGRIVAVTAQVDVTRRNERIKRNFEKGEGTIIPVVREKSSTSEQSQAGSAAEPGVRSNATADIRSSGGNSGSSMNTTDDETELQPFVGTSEENVVDPRGMPTWLAVSVNVPRGYVVQQVLASKPKADTASDGAGGDGGDGSAAEPAEVQVSEAEVLAAFDQIKKDIEASIQPHLPHTKSADSSKLEPQGDVVVSLIPGEVPATGSSVEQAGMSGGIGSLLASGGGKTIETAVLSALAVLALLMMALMVRKAARQTALPTAEELVGLPPPLERESSIIGEASEGDTPLTGIELGDEELSATVKLDQVRELVSQDPQASARLLNRWVVEDH